MWIGLCVWIVAVVVGWSVLTRYSNQASPRTTAPDLVIPAEVSQSAPYRLLMFVHPRCPCSVASLRELARVMSRCPREVDATIHFYRPETAGDDWVHGNLWDSAMAIPGVRAAIDPGGKTAGAR